MKTIKEQVITKDIHTSILLPKHKARLVFGSTYYYVTKKPNLLFTFVLKLMGIGVQSV